MSYAKPMLDTYPRDFKLDADQIVAATDFVRASAAAGPLPGQHGRYLKLG